MRTLCYVWVFAQPIECSGKGSYEILNHASISLVLPVAFITYNLLTWVTMKHFWNFLGLNVAGALYYPV